MHCGIPMAARNLLSRIFYWGVGGALITLLLFVWDYSRYHYYSENFYGYLFEGCGIALFLSGGNYLWKTFVRPIVEEKHSLSIITRLPFWFMAGGMGYVMGLLFAKKMGFLFLYERPIKTFFFFGGYAGMLLQYFYTLSIVLLRKQRRVA